LLWRGRGHLGRLVCLGVYAGACVLLFTMSAGYHMAVRGGTAHRIFERLDHAAIFVLIAGTFTPAHGLLYRGWARWGPLLLVWTTAAAGIALKTAYFDRLTEGLGLSCYMGLGWVGFVSALGLWRRYGFSFVLPLLLGGVAYSVGAVMEFHGWLVVIPGVVHPHEVFHVAVLHGAVCHWVFVWQFATGGVRWQSPYPFARPTAVMVDALRSQLLTSVRITITKEYDEQ
jgi:channel protein (hemolysin III family)